MSKVALDLSQFKHVSSTDKTTTLKHKDGHFLNLAHKALGPDVQKQLAALAKGPTKSTDKAEAVQDQQSGLAMAEGGEVPSMTWDQMSKDQRIQALMADPETFQRAQAMFAGSIGGGGGLGGAAGEAGALESAEAQGGMRQMPAEGMGKPARGVGQGITIKDNLPPVNPNVTNVVGGQPIVAPKISAYADGGDVEQQPYDTSQLYSTDPNEAAPVLQQAYDTGRDNAIKAEAGNKYAQSQDEGQDIFSDKKPLTPAEAEAEALKERADKEESEAKFKKEQVDENAERERSAADAVASGRARLGMAAPAAAQPAAQAPMAPRAPAGQDIQQMAGGAGQPPQQGLPDVGTLAGQAYNLGNQGAQAQAQAEAGLGQAEAGVLDDQTKRDTDVQAHFQNAVQGLEKERQAHIADIQNGYVNPDRYWTGYTLPNGEKVEGHSKVASAIGMIMAGFNPTNNPNAAVNFLKMQMEQGLDAQRQNLQSDHNLLSANLQQFHNVKDATDMTRVMMNDAMQHKLAMEAAKAKTPMAQAALLQAKAKIAQDTIPIAQNLQMRQALMSLNSDPARTPGSITHAINYLRMANPEAAKEAESRLVPNADGQGREALATVPVPPNVRGEMIAKQQFGQAVKQLRDWSASHSGDVSPSDVRTGQAMASNVQNLYREGINGGVFKPSEQGFIGSVIDSEPTKFFNSIRVLPKLDEAMRANDVSLNTLKKGYGLPATQTAPQSQPVKGKDGKMYVLDPRTNHYIPIKGK